MTNYCICNFKFVIVFAVVDKHVLQMSIRVLVFNFCSFCGLNKAIKAFITIRDLVDKEWTYAFFQATDACMQQVQQIVCSKPLM